MISYLSKQQWFQTKLHIDSQQGSGNNSHLLLDLSDTSLLQRYFELFRYLRQQLTQQQIIRKKVIYFSPLVQNQGRLAQIARNHGADISDNHTNLVTHVCMTIFLCIIYVCYLLLNIECKDKVIKYCQNVS